MTARHLRKRDRERLEDKASAAGDIKAVIKDHREDDEAGK